MSRRGRNGWRWLRQLLTIRHKEIAPRLAGAAFGDAQAGRQRLAGGELAHGRRRDVAVAGKPLEYRACQRPDETTGTAIWGGKPGNELFALVGVLVARSTLMPPAIPVATYACSSRRVSASRPPPPSFPI